MAFGPAVLMLVVAGVTVANIREVALDQLWVTHTHEVIETLLIVQRETARAEASQRAYGLGGSAVQGARYGAAVGQTMTSLDHLVSLTADSPERQERGRDLTRRVRDLFEEPATDPAREADLDGVVAQAQSMADVERTLLSERRLTLDRERLRTLVVLAAGSLIAFVFGIAVNASIRANLAERTRKGVELQLMLLERNRALAELETSNGDLDQFAYVASHDLKAPLRGIANLSAWVEEDLGAAMTDGARDHLKRLRGRVHRMEALIDGILAYSRAGKATQPIETVAVGSLVREVVEILAVPEGRVAVRTTGSLPTLRTERVPLQQILMNLISNAVKHNAREGAEVQVEARRAEDAWELSVLDNGPGVPVEYRERIFGIFQRLDSRDKVEGAGIGLSIVQKLVTRRGGRVWVEESPSGGAAFRFTWPDPQ